VKETDMKTSGEAPTAQRILVVANETVASDVLLEAIRRRAGEGVPDVFVVAPALSSRLQRWASDHDRAYRSAQERLVCCLAGLRHDGIAARGWVGDADPMLAIEDARRMFPADELIIATHSAARSNWLARGIVERARTLLPLPVTHIVVDSGASREHAAEAVPALAA
jgi:GABA permease